MKRRTFPFTRSSSATREAFQRETKPRRPSLAMTDVYGREAGMRLNVERSKRWMILPSLVFKRRASSELLQAISRRSSPPRTPLFFRDARHQNSLQANCYRRFVGGAAAAYDHGRVHDFFRPPRQTAFAGRHREL